jgi:type VI secretion system protein ImpM
LAIQPGFFGKIPAHGDFIDRNLSRSFIQTWDDWLQRSVACSQEQLGSQWLDIYLTSPIWRFVTSTGAVDNQCWAGILVPSVDSVGRYFPLTIAHPISADNCLFDFLLKHCQWFSQLEEIAIASLQNYLDAEALMQALQLPDELISSTPPNNSGAKLSNGLLSHVSTPDLGEAYANLLHQIVTPQTESYSLWWSQGSQRMQPSLLHVKGLPEAQQFAAFLDGNWQQWR